jgi:hypothetical protein
VRYRTKLSGGYVLGKLWSPQRVVRRGQDRLPQSQGSLLEPDRARVGRALACAQRGASDPRRRARCRHGHPHRPLTKDKFIVRDADTENEIWWDNNGAITRDQFNVILEDFLKHAEGKQLFAQDLYGGSDPAHRVRARVFTEYAWHSLFIRNLLIRPDESDLPGYVPDLTIIDLPTFKADPARHSCRSETIIACDFTRKIVLVGSSSYAGR